MKNRLSLALLSIPFLLSFLAGCGNSNSSNNPPSDEEFKKHEELREIYTNPISLPSANRQTEAADPFIYRYNGMYYLYMTTGGGTVRGYQSEDLINFEPVTGNGLADGIVYSYASDPNKPSAQTPFAPEVIYYNGYFYMTFSPSGQGHYILRSESPTGPFECITPNLGKSIDGSFFIDSNEDIYFYTAGGNNIAMYKLNDDFESFVLNDSNNEFHASILEASMDGWTEGPFMLKRDGQYYFTYTGNHYLSNDYRVDYAYVKEGKDISKISSFEEKDNVLLSVTEDFKGLGHSCTVLGPDMDSYYIVYHELKDDRSRGLCVSRLSFNGSKMVVNNPLKDLNFKPASAEFHAKSYEDLIDDNEFMLSNIKSEDAFTSEFNVTGLGKLIFSYVDNKNYAFIEVKDNSLTLNKVNNGKVNEIEEINLLKTYDYNVNHTIRVSYKDGLLDIFFDNIEKLNNYQVSLNGGKIGYFSDNSFSDIGYTAFSNVAQGSSDNKEYNSSLILANAYDLNLTYLNNGSGLTFIEGETPSINKDSYNLKLANKGDYATYRIYQDSDDEYYLNLRVDYKSLNKKIGIRLNDGEIITKTLNEGDYIYKKGDAYLNLGTLNLKEGQQYISIYNVGDEISFSEIKLERNDDGSQVSKDFKVDNSLNEFNTRGKYTKSKQGIYFNEFGYGEISTLDTYTDYTLTLELKVEEILNGGYFGLMLNAKNNSLNGRYSGDSNYRAGNYEDNYQGLKISFTNSNFSVNNVSYNIEGLSYGGSDLTVNLNEIITISLTKENNNYELYFNDELIKEFNTNYSSLRGQLGFITSDTKVIVQSISIDC